MPDRVTLSESALIESSCGKYAASKICVTAGKKAGEVIIPLLLELIQQCVASVGFFKMFEI